jgi:hypothetical protein
MEFIDAFRAGLTVNPRVWPKSDLERKLRPNNHHSFNSVLKQTSECRLLGRLRKKRVQLLKEMTELKPYNARQNKFPKIGAQLLRPKLQQIIGN